jgi:Uma2 family endonuclease
MMTPQILTRPLPGTTSDPLYPDSDGKPMSETDYHSDAMVWLRDALRDYFTAAGRDDVYVGMNLLLYYEQGNPSGRRDPDVLVAKGVGNHKRLSFRLWEENAVPQVIFEVSSPKTWRKDLGAKRALYERLGVAEYFLFDPQGVCLDPRLQGFRLEQGVYIPLTPSANGSLTSEELGLRITVEEAMLRLTDLQTGAVLLTRSERADEEHDRAEQERRRAEQGQIQAEQERRRAEQERLQVEHEHRRAEELAAEVTRLRALLKEQKGED